MSKWFNNKNKADDGSSSYHIHRGLWFGVVPRKDNLTTTHQEDVEENDGATTNPTDDNNPAIVDLAGSSKYLPPPMLKLVDVLSDTPSKKQQRNKDDAVEQRDDVDIRPTARDSSQATHSSNSKSAHWRSNNLDNPAKITDVYPTCKLSKTRNQNGDSDFEKKTDTSEGSEGTQSDQIRNHDQHSNIISKKISSLNGYVKTMAKSGQREDPDKLQGLLPTGNNSNTNDQTSIPPTSSNRNKMERAMEAAVKSYEDDTVVARRRVERATLSANDLAAGQLMQWKTQAEEGPCWIQCAVFLLAVAAIGTTLYPVIMIQDYWSFSSLIVACHTVVLSSLILIFELRSLGLSLGPLNVRSKVRAIASRYLNILRLLWGRGLLYIFAGSMTVAVGWLPCVCVGCALALCGVVAIFSGARASFNLDRLKSSVTDEVYLWTKFDAVDDDHDEMIGVDGFATLIWSLGLELNDSYTYQTFVSIDKDKNGLISFEDFKGWWFEGQEQNRNGGYVKRIIV